MLRGRICEAFLAEVALQLSGLAMAVEQVALANVTALELTVLGNGKSLFCTAVRFDLRHKVLLSLNLRYICALVLLVLCGRQKHQHLAAFELGLLFYRAALRAQLREAMEQILTKRRVRDLAATEANRNLDLGCRPAGSGKRSLPWCSGSPMSILGVRRISLISTTR